MKTRLYTILLSIIVTTNSGKAQNWDLFPYGAKLSYLERSTTRFSVLCNDSINFDGLNTIYFCNAKAPKSSWQHCYDLLNASIPYKGNKIYFTGNGNEYLIYNNIDSTNGFYFNTDIGLGDFWAVPIVNPASLYDELTVTFDSIDYINVLGDFDSVRYYSIGVSPEPEEGTIFEGNVFTLSKNHGLLSFPNFGRLVNGSLCPDCMLMKDLVGFIQTDDSMGITIPKWSDYIQLQPDDILVYRSGTIISSHGVNEVDYFVDKITSVDKYPDSIVVNFIRNDIYPGRHLFSRSVVQALFEGYNSSYHYGAFEGNHPTLTDGLEDGFYYISSSDGYNINSTRFENATCIEYSLTQAYVDTVDCTRHAYSPTTYSISSGIGLISSYANIYGWVYTQTLVGSILSGHASGEIFASQFGASNKAVIEIQLLPNPTSDVIILPIACNENESYQVYNQYGSLVGRGPADNPVINISDLASGMYVVFVKHDNLNYAGKFLKL